MSDGAGVELDGLAAAAAGASPKLDLDEQRLALTLYRLLAEGRPCARCGDSPAAAGWTRPV